MKSKINYLAIILYYLITVGLRYLATKTDILSVFTNDFLQIILRGAGPAIGALVVFNVFNKKSTMSLKGSYRDLMSPILMYWILPIFLITIIGYFSTEEHFIINSVFAVLTYGLLEEIGWRGFLQQELKVLPKYQSILIITILWFCWHLNFELTAANFIFFLILLLGSWGIGYVADKTSSLLAVAGFHSLHNFFPKLETTQMIIIIALLFIWITSLILKSKLHNNS